MYECPDSVVRAPSGCLLDVWCGGGLALLWTLEDPGLAPGEKECPLATSLRDASVGPAYLARPTSSEEGRPSGLGVGEEGCPLATGLQNASVGPAYLARPTRSEEGGPKGLGVGESVCGRRACVTRQ